uniref:Solute carrier family 25 member 10 n=1 Tax=Serinus canaria TaxID=9135 RepID=A0A8C9N8S5_SERCA
MGRAFPGLEMGMRAGWERGFRSLLLPRSPQARRCEPRARPTPFRYRERAWFNGKGAWPCPGEGVASGRSGAHGGAARFALVLRRPRVVRGRLLHAPPGPAEEGVKKLFSGASVASLRGALVTVGQLSCYDQTKQLVLATGFLSDNIFTHFLSSFIAGLCATFLCQPLDVLKTRLMNSHGEYQGVVHCAMETAKLGPLAFYKGFVPAAVRLVPQTVLTFLFLEQLRKYFGIKVTT